MNLGSEQSDYNRGHMAGGIEQRLAGHDKHFAAINGNLSDIAREVHGLRLAVQRLADQAVARDATVVTTAAALKDAEEACRDKTETAWSPIARLLAGLAGVATVVGLVVGLVSLFNRWAG
jgi:hypothetical protein